MTTESISLLTVILIHFSLVVAGLSISNYIDLIRFVARVHALPILSCIIASIFAIVGINIVSKVFLIITLFLLLIALLRTWRSIVYYFKDLQEQKAKDPLIKNNEK